MLKPKDVKDYFLSYPEATQHAMNQVKAVIYKVVPEAEESISYGIPTYKYRGLLAHFGGYDKHIGFYPGAKAIEVFKDEISGYKNAKGSVQFPLDQPMPLDLIERMVRFRLEENTANIKAKKE
ncbi:hypothetical protein DYU05_10935 [Mucilaginibacter terrenus]|uniref:YdhG-like domain-containing protein n=1 Tax=Mucilaginibacter terrenus TaxID=2482727 RepID=A0A3E2NNX6_9SPHI|nr:DUF1801 domain-containing protein [Mucilaginibacter terrenus]RFZ82688.1 hypothetical protein DYU05_10935 [Mucilaginibacter terrenus]